MPTSRYYESNRASTMRRRARFAALGLTSTGDVRKRPVVRLGIGSYRADPAAYMARYRRVKGMLKRP